MSLHTFVHLPAVLGAITGLTVAAHIDIAAFLEWKDYQSFTTYDWRTAAFRWLQGIVHGALVGGGYGWLVS